MVGDIEQTHPAPPRLVPYDHPAVANSSQVPWVQGLQPDAGGRQQTQRVDVIGACRRAPHRAPVQAGGRAAAGVAGAPGCRSRWTRPRAVPPVPPPAPARSWCAARPDAPVTRPGGRPARPRTPPSPAPRRTPADRRRRPGPRRGGHGSSSGDGASKPASPPGGAAAARTAGRRRRGPARPARSATTTTANQRIRPVQRPAAGTASRPRHSCGPGGKLWTKHPFRPCKLLHAARLRGLTSRACGTNHCS